MPDKKPGIVNLGKAPSSPLTRATKSRTPNADQFMSMVRKLGLEPALQNRVNADELENISKATAKPVSLPEEAWSSAKREVGEIGSGLGALGTALVMPPPGATRLGIAKDVVTSIPGALVGSLKQTFTTNPIETLRTRPVAGLSDIALGAGTGLKAAGIGLKAVGTIEGLAGASEAANAVSKLGHVVGELDPIMATLKGTFRLAEATPGIGPALTSFREGAAAVRAGREAERTLVEGQQQTTGLLSRYSKELRGLTPEMRTEYDDFAANPMVREYYDPQHPFHKIFRLEQDIVHNENTVLAARFAGHEPRSLESIVPARVFLEPTGGFADVASKEIALQNAPKILDQAFAEGASILPREEAVARRARDTWGLVKDFESAKRFAENAVKEGKGLIVPLDDLKTISRLHNKGYISLMPSALAKGVHLQTGLEQAIVEGFYNKLSPETLKAIGEGLVTKSTPEIQKAISEAAQEGTAAFMKNVKELGPELLKGADTHAFMIPKTSGQSILKEMGVYATNTGPLMRLSDEALKVWKISTLALSPAWVIGNAVGSAILSILAGVSPSAHAKLAVSSTVDVIRSLSKIALGKGITEKAFENLPKWVTERMKIADSLIPRELKYSGESAFQASGIGHELQEKFPGLPPNPHQGSPFIPKAISESQIGKSVGAFVGEKIRDIFQFNAVIEDHFRKAAFISESARQVAKERALSMGKNVFDVKAILDKVAPQLNMWDEPSVQKMAQLAKNPEFLNQAIPKVEQFLGSYKNMTTFERVRLKRLFPFYSWTKFINTLALSLPVKFPVRAAILRNMTAIYRQERNDPNRPKWMDGLVQAGVTMTPGGPKLKFVSLTGTNILFGLGRLEQSVNPFLKFGIERITGRDVFRDFQAFQDPDVFVNPTNGKAFKATPHGLEEVVVEPPFLSHFLRLIPQTRLIEDILTPALRYSGSGIFDPKIRGEINQEIDKLALRIGTLRKSSMATRVLQLPQDFDKITDDYAELQAAEAKFERLKALRAAGDISAYQRPKFSALMSTLGLKEFQIYEDDLNEMIRKNRLENLHGVLAKALKDPDLRLRVWEATEKTLREKGDFLPVFEQNLPTKARMFAPSTDRGPSQAPAP